MRSKTFELKHQYAIQCVSSPTQDEVQVKWIWNNHRNEPPNVEFLEDANLIRRSEFAAYNALTIKTKRAVVPGGKQFISFAETFTLYTEHVS